jgi:nitrogen fixation protein FixH
MNVRWNWGTSIAIVYGLFACSTLGFVVFAMNRPADLVSQDYYQRSLRQDERMAAEANARGLADPVSFAVDTAEKRLIVEWPAALAAATGEITFYRPSNSGADRRFPIAPASGGQLIEIGDLASGRWRVQAEWRYADRLFYQEAIVTLP